MAFNNPYDIPDEWYNKMSFEDVREWIDMRAHLDKAWNDYQKDSSIFMENVRNHRAYYCDYKPNKQLTWIWVIIAILSQAAFIIGLIISYD